MAMYELDGRAPELPADGKYFIADTADVIGNIRLKSGATVWFGAVLRGDVNAISVGARTSIQDGSILHVASDRLAGSGGIPLIIGDDCTVGPQTYIDTSPALSGWRSTTACCFES